jgi:hypothetical protein
LFLNVVRVDWSRRVVARVVGVVLCQLALLAGAAPAQAAGPPNTITVDRVTPVVGELLTFDYNASSDCRMRLDFTVDGVAQPEIFTPDDSITTSFATAGRHTVSVVATKDNGGCSTLTSTLNVDVSAALVGDVTATPNPPAPGASVAFAATQTGGVPGYTYAWDSDNDGQFDDQTTRTFTATFPAAGPRTVRVRIRDAATPVHEVVVSRTITVTVPAATPTPTPLPAGATPTPAPTPVPCTSRLAFQLSEFTTSGCFTRVRTAPSEQWTTTSAIQLNGIPFADFGQTFTVTFPTDAEPGGHFTAPGSSIQMRATTFFSGDIDWRLPAGKQGEEKDLKVFAVFVGAKVFGLNIRGSIALRLGWDAAGMRYASFPLNVELPVGFNSGPFESAGRVTGAAALRTDAAGPHFDGLKIQATNVWLGKLKVLETCLSYVPGGGQSVAPCDPPDAGGKPYLQCESNVNVDRWDGNAVIELPSSRGVQFGVFGGLAGGEVSKLGGFVDNLGNRVPIASGVYLNKIGLGICMNPPPMKIKGEIGVAILPLPNRPPMVGIDGSFTYTDSDGASNNWTMEIGGRVTVYDTTVGRGDVRFGPSIPWDFDVQAAFNLYDLASLEGGITGWVDPPHDAFNVTGFVRGCLAGELCAEAYGLVSSTGAAGCIKAGSTHDTYLVILDHEPYLKFITRTTTFRVGFGYTWATKRLDLLGNSCNFAAYTATKPARSARAHRAADGVSLAIADGTDAISLRYHGSNGPPKIVLTGPDGSTVTSPASAHTQQVEGRFMLVEDERDATTNVVLLHPAAGEWTAVAAPGGSSAPTSVDRAALEAPPTVAARVTAHGVSRSVAVTYAVPAGASVQLVERGAGITRVITKRLAGRACAHGPAVRPGTTQRVQCASVQFHPSPGPGGKRTIEAVVTRSAVPLSQQAVATFTAPPLRKPARPGALRARRVGGDVLVSVPRVRGASRLSVSAVLSDGRALSLDVRANCGAVRIPSVPVGVGGRFTVVGVRYDLATGPKRSVSIAAAAQRSGRRVRAGTNRGVRVCS